MTSSTSRTLSSPKMVYSINYTNFKDSANTYTTTNYIKTNNDLINSTLDIKNKRLFIKQIKLYRDLKGRIILEAETYATTIQVSYLHLSKDFIYRLRTQLIALGKLLNISTYSDVLSAENIDKVLYDSIIPSSSSCRCVIS